MFKVQISVEVKSSEVRVMEGVAKRTGRPYKMREQSAWADTGKAFPQELRFVLSDNQDPYPVGRYVIDESAVSIDRNGSFQVSTRFMKAVAAASPVAAGVR